MLDLGTAAICRHTFVPMEARSYSTARSESDRKRGEYCPRDKGGGLFSERHDHNLSMVRRPQVCEHFKRKHLRSGEFLNAWIKFPQRSFEAKTLCPFFPFAQLGLVELTLFHPSIIETVRDENQNLDETAQDQSRCRNERVQDESPKQDKRAPDDSLNPDKAAGEYCPCATHHCRHDVARTLVYSQGRVLPSRWM
jgi:hypothetical protein